MSAAQIIEQIRALRAEEQEKVVSFVRSLDTGKSEERVIEHMDPKQAKELSTKIFGLNSELFRKLAQ